MNSADCRSTATSTVTPDLIAEWRCSIGHTVRREQYLDIEGMRRFALALGGDKKVELRRPALAHWAWFLPELGKDEIGYDGTPIAGDFFPPISLSRRMLASTEINFGALPVLGEKAAFDVEIVDVSHKSGRTGELVFVKVRRTLLQSGKTCLSELQTYVFRGAGAPVSLPAPRTEEIEGKIWLPDEVSIFRFSAATFNAHRIHYDQSYTTTVEGYPALIVQGAFTAAKIAEHVVNETGRELLSFNFKALAPLFVNQPVWLARGRANEYVAVRCDGVIAMVAEVNFR